nr:13850_t:CDS:2 [Entrophospora candida]
MLVWLCDVENVINGYVYSKLKHNHEVSTTKLIRWKFHTIHMGCSNMRCEQREQEDMLNLSTDNEFYYYYGKNKRGKPLFSPNSRKSK